LLREIPGYDPFATAAPGEWFDPIAAQRALDFFPECLKHVEGEKAGQPFVLERWQQAVVANVFGWKRKDGRRRYRQVFVFVPRKNGKTFLAAGLLTYILFCDPEPGAKIYGAAGEYGQACLVFDAARGMILQEEELNGRCKIYNGQSKSITIEDKFRAYRVVSGDRLDISKNKHGFNPHAYVIDELHTQSCTELVDTFETATGARREPLGLYLTTSDYEREGSVCNEKHEYASSVRDGVVHDSAFLPVIYEASVDDGWKDPATWRKANPNVGVSISREYLEAQCKKAIEIPRFENTFKRLHLNLRTEQEHRWVPMDHWEACAAVVRLEDMAGRRCCGGIDLAKTSDMTGLVLAFPHDDDVGCTIVPFFFMPKDGIDKNSKRDKVDYRRWAAQGLLELTPGNVTDYNFVKHRMRELIKVYDVQEWPYDPHNASQFATDMQDEGAEMVEFRQGFLSMNEPSKEFERLVVSHQLRHPNHPILNWHARNVCIKEDAAGNIKPIKTPRGLGKRVDGIIAAIMAIARAQAMPSNVSVYENQDGLVLI
jgi:phage terminase large subunit-like protein